LSFEEAAAVPTAGGTAFQGLRHHAGIQPGQQVLINGGSGGVGTFAVQIAKSYEAEVTGVTSTGNIDLVRSLGADHVVDYTAEDFMKLEGEYDVILDIGGNSKLARLRRTLSPTGTLVFVGGETGGKWLGGMQRQIGASLISLIARQNLKMFVSKENHEDLLTLTELIEAGKVTPAVERTYPLSEAAKAIRHMEEGHARGKLVITV
jgi:NADPH:quinone reductase-like Zn-dependent oxidoreductase